MGDQEKAKREHFEKERRKLEQKIDQNERERDGLLKLAEVRRHLLHGFNRSAFHHLFVRIIPSLE